MGGGLWFSRPFVTVCEPHSTVEHNKDAVRVQFRQYGCCRLIISRFSRQHGQNNIEYRNTSYGQRYAQIVALAS